MILFYSDYCPYCRTLLEEIKRKDVRGQVRLVSIEALRAGGRALPPNIHSVPALLTLPDKNMMFGRPVFDYLFLPGSGKLLGGLVNEVMNRNQDGGEKGLQGAGGGAGAGPGETAGAGGAGVSMGSEPMPFSLLSGSSEAFTYLEGPESLLTGNDTQRSYCWSSLDPSMENRQGIHIGGGERSTDPLPVSGMGMGYNAETRKKKEMPSIDNIKQEREVALKNYLSGSQLPPPSATR